MASSTEVYIWWWKRKEEVVCVPVKMVTYFHMSSFNFSLYHFNIMSKSETRLKADYTISMAALHNNWYKLRLWDSCMTMKAASTHNPYPKLPVQHCSLPSKQAKEWLPLESVKAFCHVLGSISNVILSYNVPVSHKDLRTEVSSK